MCLNLEASKSLCVKEREIISCYFTGFTEMIKYVNRLWGPLRSVSIIYFLLLLWIKFSIKTKHPGKDTSKPVWAACIRQKAGNGQARVRSISMDHKQYKCLNHRYGHWSQYSEGQLGPPADVFLKNMSYLFNNFGINMNWGFSNKELSQLT